MSYFTLSKNYDNSINRYYNNIHSNDPMRMNSDLSRLPTFDCDAELLNADLWNEFHKLGTEMIITKNGRCMFPTLCVRFHGLEDGVAYAVSVELRPTGGGRWTRSGGHWAPANPPSAVGRTNSPPAPSVATPHPLSPAPASLWSLPLKFNNLKLTNNIYDVSGCVILRSMHKYLPVLKIRRLGERPAERCFTFPETEFIAVTAYQNCDVAQLKIDKNPYAKGFRERERKRNKVKRQQSAPSLIEETPSQCQPLDCSLIRDDTRTCESSAVSVSSSSSDISVCGSPTPDPPQRVEFAPYPINDAPPHYLGYLMSEWTRSFAYGNMYPAWVPPRHDVHEPWRQFPVMWHNPIVQPKVCNESKPKGSSFTIRALLQEN